MAEEKNTEQQGSAPEDVFQIQKIYLKDASFESPNSPAIHTMEWKPGLAINVANAYNDLGNHVFEVVLRLTVTVTIGDSTAYLAEVHQAGVFTLNIPDHERLELVLQDACLRILYPYAFASLSDMVARGGFPQLLVTPINFGDIYLNRKKQAQQTAATEQK